MAVRGTQQCMSGQWEGTVSHKEGPQKGMGHKGQQGVSLERCIVLSGVREVNGGNTEKGNWEVEAEGLL